MKLIFAFIFSVKSFFAASKFKKRRNKDENNKKHVALQSFYSWFEDSQALDRILNMVKNRKLNDEALITEIIYLTKRVINIKDCNERYIPNMINIGICSPKAGSPLSRGKCGRNRGSESWNSRQHKLY